MTSIWSCGYLQKDQVSVTLLVALFTQSKATFWASSQIDSEMDKLEKSFILEKPFAFSSIFELFITSFGIQYLNNNLQYILKTVLEARTSMTLVFLENPCEKLLKARFSYVYYGKIKIKCYKFC